jgi:hypothetical protein
MYCAKFSYGYRTPKVRNSEGQKTKSVEGAKGIGVYAFVREREGIVCLIDDATVCALDPLAITHLNVLLFSYGIPPTVPSLTIPLRERGE